MNTTDTKDGIVCFRETNNKDASWKLLYYTISSVKTYFINVNSNFPEWLKPLLIDIKTSDSDHAIVRK